MPTRDPGDDITRQLKPGDVLLFHGHGAIPWAIRRFDESDVDHAAIVLDPPDTVVEATGSGIRHAPVLSRVDESTFTYVHRLTNRLDAGAAARAAVALEASNASSIHERLVLLAILGMTRRLPIAEPSLRRLLSVLLDRSAEVAAAMIDADRRSMLASDLVYQAYRSTGDPALSLEILFPSEKPSLFAAPIDDSARRDVVLMEWASARPAPDDDGASALSDVPSDLGAYVRRAERELEPLIEAFARIDAPTDTLTVASGGVPDVGDDELHRSVIAFRDQVLRLILAPDVGSGEVFDHPWGMFRAVATCVTPGDLRYSPSLRTLTSLRPRDRRDGERTRRSSSFPTI